MRRATVRRQGEIMILLPHETEQFYRIWWSLLYYVNSKRNIAPELLERKPGPLDIQLALPIREALWSDDALREAFIVENPARLSAEELAIVASWNQRIENDFYIFR